MLRSCVRVRWKGSALMLSVEEAGNNGPLSRAPGLQARRGAQDFLRWLRKVYSPNECLWYGNVCLFFAVRKSETDSGAAAGLLQSFITSFAGGEPENAADLKLIIMASAPQSNGVTRAYVKAVQIAQPLEAVCEEYDIKEDFDNKHGAPNAAAPKVFMKYFFVNTKTGEKSGEILTLITFDEDAPVEGE